jgi:hypothetical protein
MMGKEDPQQNYIPEIIEANNAGTLHLLKNISTRLMNKLEIMAK